MVDRILSNNNTTTDSFFKPYLITRGKSNTKKDDEQSQTKRKYCNASESLDEQPNKRMCKAEKFKAIEYSLRTNEEYIAIRKCEYDIWERNEENMSKIYQDVFQKRNNGWMDLVKEILTNIGEEFTNMEILRDEYLKHQGGLFQHNLANKLNMENLPSKYQRSFSF
ncbi:hypothetical protein Tco_0821121 [Tanacetum coccineum]|uniref:Uncharacterized protein n=1 Tax=Tanacetum coccineum TaxID=301880 RepID=A0ABQ5AEI7_9ASTR